MSTKKSLPKSNELGEKGFSESYWSQNYDEPEEMDGIANAAHHARYIKTFFDVEFVDISSIIDFGFGLGFLFEAVLKEFYPYRAVGLEPSEHAFNTVKKRQINPVQSARFSLKKQSIQKWAESVKPKSKWFDLGLCTSVFQHLSEEDLQIVLPIIARQVKYLYFSVPTDRELERQVRELDFYDQFAYRRSKKFYRDLIKPHFTIIGSRVLESKVHFNEDNSFFTDYLFRD